MTGTIRLPKLAISLAALCILGCLSSDFSGNWEIKVKPTPSSESGYYVLHDWHDTYSRGVEVSSLPAVSISDIMLKTMGILRDGASWPGVLLGNLFSRPSATALFVIDGVSSGVGSLSQMAYKVDQTGLSGCTCADMKRMFEGDNVATHLSNLFDHTSQTYSVSANIHAAQAASAEDSHTSETQLNDLVTLIQNGEVSLSQYGLQDAANKLDLSSKVDSHFVAELVLIRQAVEQLEELKSYVSDGIPDVYVFTVSTLRSIEERYGVGSSKAKLAAQLVKTTIEESTKQLVNLYNERILVQALVLTWDFPEVDPNSSELSAAFEVLQPHLEGQTKDIFLISLPNVAINKNSYNDAQLCSRLMGVLKGSNYYVHCPRPEHYHSSKDFFITRQRDLRSVNAPEEQSINVTVAINSLVENRSDDFAAIFLITLFIMVSLGLAVFATSWSMWTMDPGRDSIIYRQVSDPTEGIALK